MRDLASKRRRRVWARRGASAGALALLAVAGSAAGEPDPTYPNVEKFGQGFRAAYDSTTLSYAAKSKQWIKLPDVVLASTVNTVNVVPGGAPPSCTQQFGDLCNAPADASNRVFADARVYPVAALPANPGGAHFDAFPDVTVKTVAFGSIPVDATLSLSLPTDAAGLPAGLHGTTTFDDYPAGAGNPPPEISDPAKSWTHFFDTPVAGGVWVRVKTLSVDGVPVDVGDHCRTAQPAKLNLIGKGYSVYDSDSVNPPPSGYFQVLQGGTLTGTIDVPRFTGCGTGREDLSPLVSSVASGDGYPVEAQTGRVFGACWNENPAIIDWRQCPPAPEVPIPKSAP
jgi:hypothetical protein